jgi:geranylgeranyl diphosphate synthase type I
MIFKIKNKIEKELSLFIKEMDKAYSLKAVAPILLKETGRFALRKGKRLRPILFVLGYKGYSGKEAPGLYRSALAFELLHDFLLIHDDIVDRSDTRRGRPSLHKVFEKYLRKRGGKGATGEDLAVIAGDIIYAVSLRAFLSIKESPKRKEAALENFIGSAVRTCMGEFIELLYAGKNIESVSKSDIYGVYDLKTAHYSFAAPLVSGALMAGASGASIEKLTAWGMNLGRAFQIKDDIIGIFEEEGVTGKSPLTDLRESKKTLIVWQAYRNSGTADRRAIERVFSGRAVTTADLLRIRRIIERSGSLDAAKGEVALLMKKAESALGASAMKREYRSTLSSYAKRLLEL